jgi:hypothetical protein
MDMIVADAWWMFGQAPTLIPIAGALLGAVVWLSRRLEHPKKVWQIRSPRDPHISLIEKIQRETFPENELDPEGLLERRIAASRISRFGRARGDTVMIALYYKSKRRLRGYLSAEYFPGNNTIFFWYLVHVRRPDKETEPTEDDVEIAADERDVAVGLIREMFKICQRTGRPWHHLIAEIDVADANNARRKVRRFQMYGDKLRKAQGADGIERRPLPAVFKVDMPFRMPLHDADMLQEATTRESPGWLVYAPNDVASHRRADGHYAITRADVGLLLDTLARSYHDGDNPGYNTYVKAFFAGLAAPLPEELPLIHTRSEM